MSLPPPFTMMFPSKEIKKFVFLPDDENANHHLWQNRGTWWMLLTAHFIDGTKERLRFSLRTGDVKRARKIRDGIISDLREKYFVTDY